LDVIRGRAECLGIGEQSALLSDTASTRA
jgi:hypothetical protein